ncbi:MAG: SPOR domain-containing protein [Bacteroidia bacterium]|nr:SPOR domain-containing protein [Bacteroidia bacterium]
MKYPFSGTLRANHFWAVLAILGFAQLHFSEKVLAQTQPGSRWSVSLGGGITLGRTDVKAELPSPTGSLYLAYNLTPALTLGLQGRGAWTEADADDEFGRYYKAQHTAIGLRTNLYLGEALRITQGVPRFQPYVLLGLNYLTTEVTDVANPVGQERTNYSGNNVVFSYGVGFKLHLGTRVDWLVEAENYFGQDDLLDGHNENEFGNKFNDQLLFVQTGLSLRIGRSKRLIRTEWSHLDPDYLPSGKRDTVVVYSERIVPARLVDTDADGVVDSLDLDNTTPPNVRVTTRGVALDTDYDGIADYLDPCPLQPGTGGEPCPPAPTPGADGNRGTGTPTVPTEAPATYYIIGGALVNPQHAQNLVQALKAKGFAEAQILPRQPTTIRGRKQYVYRVAVAQYRARDAAYGALQDYRKRLGGEVWVFTVPDTP